MLLSVKPLEFELCCLYRACSFGCLKEASKSVQVFLNGIEALRALTLIVLDSEPCNTGILAEASLKEYSTLNSTMQLRPDPPRVHPQRIGVGVCMCVVCVCVCLSVCRSVCLSVGLSGWAALWSEGSLGRRIRYYWRTFSQGWSTLFLLRFGIHDMTSPCLCWILTRSCVSHGVYD